MARSLRMEIVVHGDEVMRRLVYCDRHYDYQVRIRFSTAAISLLYHSFTHFFNIAILLLFVIGACRRS